MSVLSDRRQQVLRALIEEYVARALPVGSRTLVERYKLGVSPATVRNELSVLEDGGYIVQPHTSSGRIPTDSGYRAFVDEIISSGAINESVHEEMVEMLRANATELDDLFDKTSAALTRLTDCLSIVLAPSLLAVRIKQISLVSLAEHQVLVIVVTEEGQVMNRHLDFAEAIDCDDLAKVQSILNKAFTGKNFNQVKEEIDENVVEFFKDPLVATIFEEVLACLNENKMTKPHRLGISSLLTKPEFSHSQALLPIIRILEDETVLFHIFDKGIEDSETMVKIGSENDTEGLSGVSVVASQYGRGDAAGIVAVIGPTRMDYSKVIGAVHAAQHALEDL